MTKTPLEITAGAAREAKKALKSGYVVLTRSGKPVCYLLPASIYDEEDIGYMTDPEFWKMIGERRESNEFIPLEEVKAELVEKQKQNASSQE